MSLVVSLINQETQKRITDIKIDDNLLPPVGCQIETSKIRNSIYEKWTLIVVGFKLNHKDTDNSDGYGNWGETNSKYSILVEVVSYATNKPAPVIVPDSPKTARKPRKSGASAK